MYSGGCRRGWGSLDIHSIGCNERRNDSLSSVVSSSFSLLVVAAALSFATSFVTVRTPGGLVAVRAVVHLRPPRVHALQTLPQRLVVRPFRHRSRLPIRVDVFLQELLPALAVLLAPHEEVLDLARRRMFCALRTPGGCVALRAVAHHRPPRMLALQTLPQRLVRRRFTHLRRQLVRVFELVGEPLAPLAVLRAPLDERLAAAGAG